MNALNKTISALTFSTLAIALAGCNASGDGKGAVTLDINSTTTTLTRSGTVSALALINPTAPVINGDSTTAGTITLSEAWIVVKEIELEHADDYSDDIEEDLDINDDSEKVEFRGPFVIDLLSGQSYPPLPQVTIDTGIYEDIEMDIEKLDVNDLVGIGDLPGDLETTLQNYSMYLSGSYSSADGFTHVDVPFDLMYDQTDEFEFSGADFASGFVVDDSGINDIIVAFRMLNWFVFNNPETNNSSIIDFNNDVVLTSGQIILDGSTNNELMIIIEDNIEDSAEYGEDDDDDGELDEDEDDDSNNSIDAS